LAHPVHQSASIYWTYTSQSKQLPNRVIYVEQCKATLLSRTLGRQRSFAYSGPALWNSLPPNVRDPSLTQFCALGILAQ